MQNRNSKRLAVLCGAVATVAGLCGVSAPMAQAAAITGFNQTTGGPWDYNTPANWVGGTINGVWDSSLTLTGTQTITFGANTALATGLTFNYAGNFDETLRGTGGNFTLTLGGDVNFTPANSRSLTLGSTTANQNLNVNLGGATRTFTVTGQGNGSNFGRNISLVNTVSNGGIIVTGAGTGGGRLLLTNSANSLSSLGVAGAELAISGSGNASVNTVDTVSGALSINPGVAMITLTPRSTQNTLLQAGSYALNGGAALFRGTGLGTNTIASATANSTNVAFTSAPTLRGGGGAANQTTISLLPGALGDTSTTGSGFGATGGLVTYDAANGVRFLNTSTEYTAGITDQQTQLDNVRYVSNGAVQTTNLTAGTTTINSLSFAISGATGTQGATITGDPGSILKLNSGILYASQGVTGGPSTGDAMLIDVPTLDLNGQQGYVMVSTKNNSGGTTTSNGLLRISSAITNASGLTLASNGATSSYMQLTGATANTYSGVTTINGANVRLGKSISNAAIPGDLVINDGAIYDAGDQIADTSNITINGGALFYNPSNNSGSASNETFASLTMTGGSTSPGSASGQQVTITGAMNLSGGATASYTGGKLNVGGLATLSGGALTVGKARNASTFDGVTTFSSGMAITNTASDPYTPITINAGADATHFGGKLVLGGNVTFTGNAMNTNTTTIDAQAGTSPGVIALQGTQNFSIADGAAATDLTIVPGMVDGSSAGGLTKTGAGSLALSGNNIYTGGTTVSAGTLIAANTTAGQSSTGTGDVILNGGTLASLAATTSYISGTITAGTAAHTIAAGGAGTIGQLNVGGLTLNSDSTLNFDISGTDSDLLADSGFLTLTGTPLVALTSSALSATSYTLATYSASGLSNSSFDFASTPTGYHWDVTDTALQLVQNGPAVPEPSSLALLGLAATAGLIRRRRKGGE